MTRLSAVVVFIFFANVAFTATLQGSWLEDGTRQLGTSAAVFCTKRILPATFFRHAKWAPKVSADGSDIGRVDMAMSDEEFAQRFAPISSERALDIYFVIGVTQFLFEQLHIQALPVGGTLLGMLRNQGQLPHDDDADFAVDQASIALIWEQINEFKKYGLDIRTIPGIGIQIYPFGDRGTAGMAGAFFRNRVYDVLHDLTGFSFTHADLTNRGFIDVMPIRLHEEEQVYRYAEAYAEEVWWQQTIGRNLFEGAFEPYPYGPLSILGPEPSLALQANEDVYPHSMAFAMRTPDHRHNHDIKAVLVPLTEGQKRPYPLSEDHLQQLRRRFAAVGLVLHDGRARLMQKKPLLFAKEVAFSLPSTF